jgi:hypothetical protein
MEEVAPLQAEYIPARNGGQSLKDPHGYLYFKSKTVALKDRVYWTCRDRKLYVCNSKAVTQLSTGALLSCGDHNHGNRLVELKTRALERTKVEAAAAMPTVAPRTVLSK